MNHFKNILTIDEARNRPKRIGDADAVILGAGPRGARVLTKFGHSDDKTPFSGIHIADVPSLSMANRYSLKHGYDRYTEDDDTVFGYAGNLYVYDAAGPISVVVVANAEDRESFAHVLNTVGINPEPVFQMLDV